MFDSKCLMSSKGRLGSIWVAAYCFKKLNKAQVAETDISASIDKILKDDWDVIAYRVLAYLLLGVVRIYSRKVEYLFNDCHDVLNEINRFVVSSKKNEETDALRAPYESVTLPERFELDEFDLGILEDLCGGNVVSYEAITLKDYPNGNAQQFASDMYGYEDFGACHGIFSANYIPDKEYVSVDLESSLPFDGMELDMKIRKSTSEANPDVIMENPQGSRLFKEETSGNQINEQDMYLPEDGTEVEARAEKLPDINSEEKGLNHESFCGIEEPLHLVEPLVEDQETNEEQIVALVISQSADVIQEHASLKPSCRVTSSADNHQIHHEEINMLSENQVCPHKTEDGNLSYFEADKGNLKSSASSQEENMDLGQSSDIKKPQDHGSSLNDGDPEKLHDTNPPDNMDSQNNAIKDSEILGITTPKLRRAIPTPAIRKAARISGKRRCFFDQITVLPNEIIRQSIHDASDLVSKRRKVPETAHDVRRTYQISNLSQTFLEPFIPSVSEEITSLFLRSVINSTVSAEPPVKANVFEPPSAGEPEQVEIDSEPAVFEHIETGPGTPILDNLEIAPGTPIRRSASMKTFNSPKSPEAADMDRSEPAGQMEEDPCMGIEKGYPSESLEVPFVDGDQEHDFNLSNEELSSCKEVNPKLDGCSNRTRVVSRYLHRQFTYCKNQGEEEVNLLKVLDRKTKKDSARFFYETLVLKTNGYVDVKQDAAFGDILLRKLDKWDRTWGEDTDNRDFF